MTMVLQNLVLSFLLNPIQGWVVLSSQPSRSTARLHQTAIDQAEVAAMVASTDRGRKVSASQREDLEAYFQELEARCTLPAPARSPFVEGSWCVEYTDASAPSNGQLGPFAGFAYQEVDLESGRYANILKVPPNDWLTATLEATWKEWDGVLILDDSDKALNTQPSLDPNQDYGATSWLVTFESLTIKLFGVSILSQKFKNTKRVWRTTYVDENTRMVRAGRTGEKKDEMFFYMTRNNIK
jgi:PAP_fibrillin